MLVVVSVGDALRLALGDAEATRAPEGRRWQQLLATEEGRFGGGDTTRFDGEGAGTLELTAPGAVVLRAVQASS